MMQKFQNQIGSINPISTTNVKDVPAAIDKLLASYNCIDSVSLENISDNKNSSISSSPS